MYTCWHSNLAQLCTSNLAQPYEFSMALTIKQEHNHTTHNLNGHTAHAAPKASRSQAYTLPLVALLSLLSASPTSGTLGPQFPPRGTRYLYVYFFGSLRHLAASLGCAAGGG